MKVIPKLNGEFKSADGSYSLAEPVVCGAESSAVGYAHDDSIPAEGYKITVTPEKITVTSSDKSGAFYAVQTINQMREEGPIPCGEYNDAPKFHHRGFMLDVSRHFFSPEAVKKMIDECSRLKLNVLHWHLSDDQGFRIESKKFPKLNEIGSWRTEADGSVYGGYYTQEEIKDVVEYAHAHCMIVIPEIDMPGHTSSIIAAYPELSCSGEPVTVGGAGGIFSHILCAGDEKVYDFIFALIDEVIELFPDKYFHIGGDEAPKDEWKKCPHCQEEIKKHGLKDEEALQGLFTSRLVEHLNSKGKIAIGWNEILSSGDLGMGAVAHYWTDQGASYSAPEIARGRKFIFSNTSYFYFDFDSGIVTLKAAYKYEPNIPGGGEIPHDQILGFEAPLWAERIPTPERQQYMAFPRLAALAENAWTVEKDYDDFIERLYVYEKGWKARGTNSRPVIEAVNPDPKSAAAALIETYKSWFAKGTEGITLASVKAFMETYHISSPILAASPTYTEEEKAAIETEFYKLLS